MGSNKGISRREFLKAGACAAAVGSIGMLAGCAQKPENEAAACETVELPVTQEVEIPANVAAPEKTEYECDVLVIGGGFAGLNAAYAAKSAGQSVILVDKGTPGYSGLSPFVSSHRWFDAEMGDDEEAFKACINRGGEYIGNMEWYKRWIEESKGIYERLMDWGILTQYPNAAEAGYYETNDYVGYHNAYASLDRRTKFMEVLNNNDIEVIDQTMITNVITEGNKAVGAVGLHVPSGAVISISAKATVMAMGGGAYKPTGFPTGQDTFDGEYIAYNLGLPIGGKEFDDFHLTCSQAPGNAFLNNNWTYLNNIWLCGGDIDKDSIKTYADGKGKAMVLDRVTKAVNGVSLNDGTGVEDMSTQNILRRGGSLSENPNEIRKGKNNDTMFKGDVYGAAVGFGGHLSCGVFCGHDNMDCSTAIEGLYAAGDGMNCSGPTGAG
ncbi:MAG: FAD-dependent oxidoreductase, partial [Erysipelotrichaceae bacterium]